MQSLVLRVTFQISCKSSNEGAGAMAAATGISVLSMPALARLGSIVKVSRSLKGHASYAKAPMGPLVATHQFSVAPLSLVFGAEVRGLDLKEQVTGDTIEHIKLLVTEHRLLVFRNQGAEGDSLLGSSNLTPFTVKSPTKGMPLPDPLYVIFYSPPGPQAS